MKQVFDWGEDWDRIDPIEQDFTQRKEMDPNVFLKFVGYLVDHWLGHVVSTETPGVSGLHQSFVGEEKSR